MNMAEKVQLSLDEFMQMEKDERFNYELIDEEANNLGKWVKVEFIGLEDEDDDPIQIFKIVGTLEADPLQQLISNESPLGSAIVNHGVGEQVYVKPEEGEEFWAKILEISSEEIK